MQTVRFKNELERNITIKLGYANAKIYKCEDDRCPRPMCYKLDLAASADIVMLCEYPANYVMDGYSVAGLMEVGKKIVQCVMSLVLRTVG